MAKPEAQLNLALANLRRPQWPATAPDFDVEPLAPLPQTPLLTAEESMRLGLVSADRRTCFITPARFAHFAAGPQPLNVVIHAVDAEPAVPLLAFWMLRHKEAIASLGEHLARELSCSVLYALPHDLGDGIRRSLRSLSPARMVDAHYPGGYWRLLPRATRLKPAHTLIIDAIAATDLLEAMTTGVATTARPIAVLDDSTSAPTFAVVKRGSSIESLAEHLDTSDEPLDDARWFVGPRLADCAGRTGETIGDGELTFYRESRGDRAASPCIRCGACIAICPTRCDPVALLRAHIAEAPLTSKHDARNERRLHRAGLDACIECGLCTAVCPSDIELHHAIEDLRSARSGASA